MIIKVLMFLYFVTSVYIFLLINRKTKKRLKEIIWSRYVLIGLMVLFLVLLINPLIYLKQGEEWLK